MTFEEIMSFDAPRNREVFDDLAKLVKDKKVKPFVGAGVSAFAFPTWNRYLSDEFRKYTPEGKVTEGMDNLDAAEHLLGVLGKADFYADIRSSFGDDHISLASAKKEAARLLPLIFPSLIVTTNFDRVLEHVYPHAMPVAHPGHDSALNAAITRGTPLIYKVHGCVTEPENIIFTKESYDRAYGPGSPLVTALKKCFFSSTLLFLGCSLGTDKTVELWKSIAEEGIYHYTIINCTPGRESLLQKRKELGDKKIRAILYPDNQHQCLRVILEQLLLAYEPDLYQQEITKFIDHPKNPFMYDAETVHLHGRDHELELLEDFCLSSDDISWFAVSGEGGSGKTRLAYELQKRMKDKPGWDVYFIRSNNEQTLQDLIWRIQQDTLVIIDYVKWITQHIGKCIHSLVDKWKNKGIKIKFLLLERETIDLNTSIWHRDIKLKKYEAASTYVQLKDGMLYLPPLNEDNLKRIVTDFAAYHSKEASLDAGLVIDKLKKIDPNFTRPLYALFLADACINGENLRNWDKEKAVDYVCEKELYRVRKNIEMENMDDTEACYQACLSLLMYATLVNGLDIKTAQTMHLTDFRIFDSIISKHNITSLEMALNKLSIPTREASIKIHEYSDENKTVVQIAPFEPDIIGEYFCIQQMVNETDTRRLHIKETALNINTNNAGVTFTRICMDYKPFLLESGMFCLYSHIDIQKEFFKPRAFENCTELESVTIPEGLVEIPWGAFQDCKKLTEVFIPDGVKTIKGYAFNGCISLQKVALPSSLKEIGVHAFSSCPVLTFDSLPTGITIIEPEAFDTKMDIQNKIPVLQQKKVSFLGFTFKHFGEEEAQFLRTYHSAETIKTPPGAIVLQQDSIYHLPVKEIILSKSIRKVDDDSIRFCSNLRRIQIQNLHAVIESNAISHCRSLKKLVIPSRMKKILGFSFNRIEQPEREFLLGLIRGEYNNVITPPNLRIIHKKAVFSSHCKINFSNNIKAMRNDSINIFESAKILFSGLKLINMKAFYIDSKFNVDFSNINKRIRYKGLRFRIFTPYTARNAAAKTFFETKYIMPPIIGVGSLSCSNAVFCDGVKYWMLDGINDDKKNLFFLNTQSILVFLISPLAWLYLLIMFINRCFKKEKSLDPISSIDNVYYVNKLPVLFHMFFKVNGIEKKITKEEAEQLISQLIAEDKLPASPNINPSLSL